MPPLSRGLRLSASARTVRVLSTQTTQAASPACTRAVHTYHKPHAPRLHAVLFSLAPSFCALTSLPFSRPRPPPTSHPLPCSHSPLLPCSLPFSLPFTAAQNARFNTCSTAVVLPSHPRVTHARSQPPPASPRLSSSTHRLEAPSMVHADASERHRPPRRSLAPARG